MPIKTLYVSVPSVELFLFLLQVFQKVSLKKPRILSDYCNLEPQKYKRILKENNDLYKLRKFSSIQLNQIFSATVSLIKGYHLRRWLK